MTNWEYTVWILWKPVINCVGGGTGSKNKKTPWNVGLFSRQKTCGLRAYWLLFVLCIYQLIKSMQVHSLDI